MHEKQAYVLVIFSNYGNNQQFKIVPCKVIWNPGNFGLSGNPESTALELGIQLMESRIRNRILKSGIQPLMESGIHGCGLRNPQTWNPESTASNRESKTLLDYLTCGDKYTYCIKVIGLTYG